MKSVGIIGVGLIGGSVGCALREAGVSVVGFDSDPDRLKEARMLGAIDEAASSVADLAARVDLVLVAVPVGLVAPLVVEVLESSLVTVTDVGSVKMSIIDFVSAARPDSVGRFVGGHPMAGSERDGLNGIDPQLFRGATWVLTPTDSTDASALAEVKDLVSSLNAEVVIAGPAEHDALVAMVSHLPQLAASTLMDVATANNNDQSVLLRLAAGGFRDMTRIASSHPTIWTDICVANRDAIIDALDDYALGIARVRNLIDEGDLDGLLELLERARTARRDLLPVGSGQDEMIELQVPIPDRPGVLAEITALAGSLNVNIVDLQIAHSTEGGGGVLSLVVSVAEAEVLESELVAAGYKITHSGLS